MLESYDDTDGCAVSIICLVVLIVLTICAWNIYNMYERDIEYAREVKYEYNGERRCDCGCGGLDE